ncbi:MAG TPA: hypothetical protein VHQ94_14250 [Pyrinomonadaceae bacterium]|jgi:hypothetical protein|nr:hypothetical protein [Pyrinomonadaceae bacterium]
MKRKSLPLLLVVFLVSSQTSWAAVTAPANDWSAVQQIGTDEKLVVKRKDGKEFKGRMIEATETTLTIDRDGKPFGIPRDEVRRVHVISGKAEKGKWTLIGAGVGGAVGTGIGAGKYRSDRDDYGIYVYMGALIGVGAGAVGGLLFGQSRRDRKLVYSID